MRPFLFVLFGIFISAILTSCGPSKFLSPTFTPVPTLPFTPTFTPTSTLTSTPTITSSPTSTPTPIGGGSGKILFSVSETTGEIVNLIDGSKGNRPSESFQLMQVDDPPGKSLITKGQLEEILNKKFLAISFQPSPDGSKTIIYACTSSVESYNVTFCNYDVYLATLDLKSISPLKIDGAHSTTWHWSPDGAKILGSVYSNGGSSLYIVNGDGTEMKRLVELPGYALGFALSFNGSEVYWSQARLGTFLTEFRAINIDGSNNHPINGSGFYPESIQFSSDGQKVAYYLYDKAEGNLLYVADADFSNSKMISKLDKKYDSPDVLSWSHNNEYILVQRDYLSPEAEAIRKANNIPFVNGIPTYELIKSDDSESVSLGVPDTDIRTMCGWAPDDKFVYISNDNYLVLVDLTNIDSISSSQRISFNGSCPIWLR